MSILKTFFGVLAIVIAVMAMPVNLYTDCTGSCTCTRYTIKNTLPFSVELEITACNGEMVHIVVPASKTVRAPAPDNTCISEVYLTDYDETCQCLDNCPFGPPASTIDVQPCRIELL